VDPFLFIKKQGMRTATSQTKKSNMPRGQLRAQHKSMKKKKQIEKQRSWLVCVFLLRCPHVGGQAMSLPKKINEPNKEKQLTTQRGPYTNKFIKKTKQKSNIPTFG